MLQTSFSAILGVLFVFVGALNIWLIFHSSSKLKDRGASAALVKGHRIGGYVFIMLFSVMTYFMIIKIKDTPDELSIRPMIHMLLGMSLVPLLFVKVLVARYYKTYYSVLMPLGLIIFSLSFVLVSMTVGPYFLRKATIKDISLESVNMGNNKIDLEAAQALTQKRCSKCHNLDRVVSARKDEKAWLASINRMRALPGSGISEGDATTILSYLVAENGIGTMPKEQQVASVGKSLIDNRCNGCHDLDRIYKATKGPDEWRATVTRMLGYSQGNEGLFKPGDDEAIIKFLSETQTPEAVNKRNEKIADATAKGTSLIADKDKTAAKPPESIPAPNNSNLPTIIVVVFVGGFFGLLMLRRPGSGVSPASSVSQVSTPVSAPLPVAAPIPAAAPVKSAVKLPQPHTPDPKKNSILLQLARIEEVTPNARRLRLLLPEGEFFRARPGQFLTFSWMVDGQKYIRSYSICSSPTQTGYVEITVKRVENGRVSTFLNTRATTGITVEAKGPSGQFYFDETKQQQIVLIAAGSGITPMLSILRYVDDRCLNTDIMLLYSARSQQDIIFAEDLEQLKSRLHNFRYQVNLTKPEGEWHGEVGRINRAMIEKQVANLTGSTYFICGPKGFMSSVRNILLELGINSEQIKQESFGGPAATAASIKAEEEKAREAIIAASLESEPEKDAAETSSDDDGRTTAEIPIPPEVARVATGTEFKVEFTRSRKACTIPEGRSLLEVAEINGVAIPFSCRQGQCGTCTTRLVEGQVTMECEDGLDPELKDEGYILTCVGMAKSNVKLDV